MSWALLPAPDTLKTFSLEFPLPPLSSSNILQPLRAFPSIWKCSQRSSTLELPQGSPSKWHFLQRPPHDAGSSGYTSPWHPLLFSEFCPQTRIFYSFVWFCLIHVVLLNQTGNARERGCVLCFPIPYPKPLWLFLQLMLDSQQISSGWLNRCITKKSELLCIFLTYRESDGWYFFNSYYGRYSTKCFSFLFKKLFILFGFTGSYE